ncbi:hypothetical protein [Microbacterium sp. ZW T5_56]|uniref:hypothetical protein n=1 Tax=Microbacterium sp. ZW T5_56 TaxID=3378081 RepID=UPI003851876E
MSARTKALLWTGAGALFVAFVLFAPLFPAGMCVDAQDSARSYCRDWHTSVMGVETSVGMWLGGSAALLGIGLVLAWQLTGRKPRRVEAEAEADGDE